MKRVFVLIFSMAFVFICIINVSVISTHTNEAKVSISKLFNLSLANNEFPWDLGSPEMFESDGSCFSCWSDPFGGIEVICPATSYWIWCFPDPEGSPDCEESQEVFCDSQSTSCEATGDDC